MFAREVPERAVDAAEGKARLRAICGAWISYLERQVSPAAASLLRLPRSLSSARPYSRCHCRPFALWQNDLRRQIDIAVADGDLSEGLDADQLIFDIGGVMMALNNALQLHLAARAPGRAQVAIDRLLSRR